MHNAKWTEFWPDDPILGLAGLVSGKNLNLFNLKASNLLFLYGFWQCQLLFQLYVSHSSPSECDMACPSDQHLMCGAIWRMSVYDTGFYWNFICICICTCIWGMNGTGFSWSFINSDQIKHFFSNWLPGLRWPWPMEINITSFGSSFSLFLDSTLLGSGSNRGKTYTFSAQVLHIEENFTNFQFKNLAYQLLSAISIAGARWADHQSSN